MSAQKRSAQSGPDGYIIERNGQIRKLRQTIRAKYGVTLLVVIYVFIWSFAIAVYQWQAPERWSHAEIVYSHLSREVDGIRPQLRAPFGGRAKIRYSKPGRLFETERKAAPGKEIFADLFQGDCGLQCAGGSVGRRGGAAAAGEIHCPLGGAAEAGGHLSVRHVRNRNRRPDFDRPALVQKGTCSDSGAEGNDSEKTGARAGKTRRAATG